MKNIKIFHGTRTFVVKVEKCLCRSGQVQRDHGDWSSKISSQSAHEGGEVVSPSYRPPLLSRKILLVLISVRDWVDPRATVRPERLCQWKFPVTPSGIEPATFRLVAQCLNQLRHRVSSTIRGPMQNNYKNFKIHFDFSQTWFERNESNKQTDLSAKRVSWEPVIFKLIKTPSDTYPVMRH